MLDVCLLGTAGMMPLPYRFLTSLMTRYNGSSLMVDCGEATQIAVKKAGWSSYQRSAGTSAYNGKCPAYGASDDDRAERA